MSAASAAPSGPNHGYGAVLDDPAEGLIEAGDLLDDPRTEAEALCLCSLLWSSSPVARTITDTLTPSDFERPVYRELFELIATQIEAGTPHDPASVAAALTRPARAAGHRGTALRRALSDATMAGGAPEAVGHYAITVVCAAYRRGFHAAAASLTDAAQQLPQDQLFDHLVSIGRAQRSATQRLADITSTLGRPPDPRGRRQHRDRHREGATVSTDDDTTAAMVTDLATATELIHAVAREARITAPELEAADLSTLGAVLDELTSTLAHIAEQCAAATGNYPDGRILRDDTDTATDTDTHDPAARCAEAADHLHQVNRHLQAANEEARRFHAAISHIGVEVQL